MAHDPRDRHDLPTFLARAREARWKTLSDLLLRDAEAAPSRAKLQASVQVARAEEPHLFHPLATLKPSTGDLVRLEASATADGYFTILFLSSSGNLEVALPSPGAPNNYSRASQVQHLLFRLTPPSGTERVLLLWSRNKVVRSPQQWRQWLEGQEWKPSGGEQHGGAFTLRGVEILGVNTPQPDEGNLRAMVISVTHDPPRQ
jgi:hypothetical protein